MNDRTSHSSQSFARTRRAWLVGCALACALVGAHADYPDRQIKVVVGFSPGAAPDIIARTIAQKLTEILKASVFVDNRPGAGGRIGAQGVAKSAPDGYTILLGEVGSIAIAPPAYVNLPYDPAKELVGLSEVARADFVLVVPANSPAQSIADFVKLARAKSDRINLATFGPGTPGHFLGDIFADAGGFKVQPIHYRAQPDAMTGIISGDVQGAFFSPLLAVGQIKAGKMRALATTSPERLPQLPNVPTFAEAGYPKVDVFGWFAFLVPAATPEPIQEMLSRAIMQSVQSPDVKAKLEELGFKALGTTRADTSRMLHSEAQRWAQVVKASGFKGD